MKEILAVIPARLESKRLPKKVLLEINGKSIIQHVVEKCLEVFDSKKILVLTDNEAVLENLRQYPIKTFISNKECKSGSERICLAMDEILNYSQTLLNETGIINVQADQPTIDPQILNKIYSSLLNLNNENVVTPVYKISRENLNNPNIVKVIRRIDGNAIYFSRSPIPYVRDYSSIVGPNKFSYWGHVGIYGYKASVLKDWNNLPNSFLENAEKLEQLRLLDAGINIKTIEIQSDCISVDTKDDFEKVKKILSI